MTDTIFNIDNLTYSNDNGKLENISLHIKPQEVHALVSNNSSEHNVFLQALMDLNHPMISGEVTFKGKHLTKEKTSLHKHRISILHFHPVLIKSLSIAENIHLTNLPQRKLSFLVNWKKIRNESIRFLKEMEVDVNVSSKVSVLSEENKRMIYIASIFFHQPEMIVMHEALEGLSAKNALKVTKLIKQYTSMGGTILYITKQWEEALKFADEISILSNGRIADQMSVQTAKADPKRMLNKLNENDYKYTADEVNDNTNHLVDAVLKAAEFLTSEYELQDVLLLLAKEATKFMDADGCSIKLIDEKTWSIIDDIEFKQKEPLEAQLKKEVIVDIAKSNEIYYVNEKDREFDSLFISKNEVKTIICIPVLVRSQVTGIIQVYYEDLYVYSKDESRFLATLARHAAIAIEDTRLMGRSALLQESHHRIKNNLQSIVGIISLQRNFAHQNSAESVNEILENIINRIKSISAVHDLLSKDKLGRSIINVKDIIEEIISISTFDPNFKINLELDDIFIAYNKATSIALVINELVTNCFKHAFIGMDTGTIHIECKDWDDQLFISVSDNGRGLPEDFDPSKVRSLGLSILQGIVFNEFQGKMEFKSDNGTTIEIVIPSGRRDGSRSLNRSN